MFDGEIDKEVYKLLMEEIRNLNSDYLELLATKEMRMGKGIYGLSKAITKFDFKELYRIFLTYRLTKKNSTKFREHQYIGKSKKIEKNSRNYFLNERIAVYTVIFGNYDVLLEPYCQPDNIDYYIITDQDIVSNVSKWKRMDTKQFEQYTNGMDNVIKNRFYKMKPHLVFPSYKYTLYIDGNIQLITDPTEFINVIKPAYGLATYMHSERDCAYIEAEVNIQQRKKLIVSLNKHIDYLENEKFPHHYGLLQCNVLARKNNKICQKIMDEWFEEFLMHSKRDQISLPYVLYKNNIPVKEIGLLGENVYTSPSLRVMMHNR